MLADVTYGACCVGRLDGQGIGGRFLGALWSFLPRADVGDRALKSLYVFVEIAFDVDHLVGCVEAEFLRAASGTASPIRPQKLALAGTIQFATGVEGLRVARGRKNEKWLCRSNPLSAGVLAARPRLPEDVDALVFVADGRFHLESLMIRNHHVPAFRYDPYSKRLTREAYDTRQLHRLRRRAVAAAANASRVGLVLGALGRQGSPAILRRVRSLLTQRGIAHFCLILTEVTPDTLKRFDAHVDAWVQVACPRLSVDWGHHFSKPTLSPYEAHVAWGSEAWDDGHYPMDYYARSEKPWTNCRPGAVGLAKQIDDGEKPFVTLSGHFPGHRMEPQGDEGLATRLYHYRAALRRARIRHAAGHSRTPALEPPAARRRPPSCRAIGAQGPSDLCSFPSVAPPAVRLCRAGPPPRHPSPAAARRPFMPGHVRPLPASTPPRRPSAHKTARGVSSRKSGGWVLTSRVRH